MRDIVSIRVRVKNDNRNYLHSIPIFSDFIPIASHDQICSERHVIGETSKALLVRVGQTLYGEPITAFYPKSYCVWYRNPTGGLDLYVPKWMNRRKQCCLGDYK